MSSKRAVVLKVLAELFGERSGVDIAALRDETLLEDALDLDSMDVVDLAMELERRLDVGIEGKPSDVTTLGRLMELVDGSS